jgi:hypothetical protein
MADRVVFGREATTTTTNNNNNKRTAETSKEVLCFVCLRLCGGRRSSNTQMKQTTQPNPNPTQPNPTQPNHEKEDCWTFSLSSGMSNIFFYFEEYFRAVCDMKNGEEEERRGEERRVNRANYN